MPDIADIGEYKLKNTTLSSAASVRSMMGPCTTCSAARRARFTLPRV